MKARRLAKMSPTVRWRRRKRVAKAPMVPMKRNNFSNRNMSWKSALNFFLPMETTCNKEVSEPSARKQIT